MTMTTDPRALVERDGYPHIRRVGAYAFFAWLAFWSSMPVDLLCRWVGVPDAARNLASSAAFIAAFMALRDMTTRPARAQLDREGGRDAD